MTQPTRSDAPGPGGTAPEPEWTFKREGQVFGPVGEGRLREMLFAGEVDAATAISADGERYRPLGEVSGFLVDLKKAEAHLRVEREVTDSRRLAARRRRLRTATSAGLALLLLGGGLGGAVWLATARPWQRRSALLEDFGQGIAVSAPARIGVTRGRPPPEAEEVAVPVDPAAPAPRTARPARDRPAPASAPPPAGDLVLSQWDATDIEAVVARQQRSLAPCLREEARRSPDFAGEIPVEFTIGNDGRIASLWIDEPRFKQGPLRDCMLRVLQGWRFKPFPGQQPVVALAFRIG